jgi:hypothetical protein
MPAYEWLTHRARRRHMAGATVIRGIHGFGSRGVVPLPGWHIAHRVPIVLEIVDSSESVARFFREEIPTHLKHGTVTWKPAAVLRYPHRDGDHALIDMVAGIRSPSTLAEFEGAAQMKTQADGVLLRIFAGDSDMHEGRPLHQAIIEKAREMGLRGAIVLKGSMGFGAHSVVHTSKVFELSSDLPVVMEVIDTDENIQKLLPALDGMVKEGMITMEAVRILVRD